MQANRSRPVASTSLDRLNPARLTDFLDDSSDDDLDLASLSLRLGLASGGDDDILLAPKHSQEQDSHHQHTKTQESVDASRQQHEQRKPQHQQQQQQPTSPSVSRISAFEVHAGDSPSYKVEVAVDSPSYSVNSMDSFASSQTFEVVNKRPIETPVRSGARRGHASSTAGGPDGRGRNRSASIDNERKTTTSRSRTRESSVTRSSGQPSTSLKKSVNTQDRHAPSSARSGRARSTKGTTSRIMRSTASSRNRSVSRERVSRSSVSAKDVDARFSSSRRSSRSSSRQSDILDISKPSVQSIDGADLSRVHYPAFYEECGSPVLITSSPVGGFRSFSTISKAEGEGESAVYPIRSNEPYFERFFSAFQEAQRAERRQANETTPHKVDPHKPLTQHKKSFVDEQHKVGEERMAKRKELDQQIAYHQQQLRDSPKVQQSSLAMMHHKMLRDLEMLFMAAQDARHRQDVLRPEDVVSLVDAKLILQKLGLISQGGGKKVGKEDIPLTGPSPNKRPLWGARPSPLKTTEEAERSAARILGSNSRLSLEEDELSPSVVKVVDPQGSGRVTFQRMQSLINMFNEFYVTARGSKAGQTTANISTPQKSKPGRVSASVRTRRGVMKVSPEEAKAKVKQEPPAPISAEFARGLEQMRVSHMGRRVDIVAPEPEKENVQEKRKEVEQANKSVVAHVEMQFNKRKDFDQRMVRERKKKEEKMMKECTFAPTLLAKPPKTVTRSRNLVVKGVKGAKGVNANQATFDRLYRTHEINEGKVKLRALEKERREQKVLDSYTFQPNVNRQKNKKRSLKVKVGADHTDDSIVFTSGSDSRQDTVEGDKDDLHSALSFILGSSNSSKAATPQVAPPSIFALSESSVSPSHPGAGSSDHFSFRKKSPKKMPVEQKSSVNGFDKTISRMRRESSGSYERKFVKTLGGAPLLPQPELATAARVTARAESSHSKPTNGGVQCEARLPSPVRFRPSWDVSSEKRGTTGQGTDGGVGGDEVDSELDAHTTIAEMDGSFDEAPAPEFPTAHLLPPPAGAASLQSPNQLPPKRNSLLLASASPEEFKIYSPMSLSSPVSRERPDLQDVASEVSAPSEVSRQQPSTAHQPALDALVAKHTLKPESPSPLKGMEPFEFLSPLSPISSNAAEKRHERSRSESALKGKVILHVDIQLTDDQSDRLSVRRGDDLGVLAEEFTKRHGLDKTYVGILEGMLRAQMEASIKTPAQARR